MTERPIRVLWTSNIVLPAAAAELGLPVTPFGGWLSLMTERLARLPQFSIGIAMRAEVSEMRRVDKDGISYFAVPQHRRDRFDVGQSHCEGVLTEFAPDILHVEGAEMRHARRFLSTWSGPRLLSMQGVLNGYAAYELGRLPVLSMLNPRRPRVMVTALALVGNRMLRFGPRLQHERAAMADANHIMGRTLWDRAQAAAINPKASYHDCPRILRDVFYQMMWQGTACERHSIFIGNAASPRKGGHIALRALALLRRDYPNVKLYIAGEDPLRLPAWSLKRNVGYPVYLRHLIDQLDLADHVVFTGVLGADAMAERLAHSHAYLMSSVIENSPNTLGEAMILGVPAVSAYAGGAPSMAQDEREALFYRADDPAMLAYQLSRIFNDSELAERLSLAARGRALVTHDPERNLAALVSAYESIIDDWKAKPHV